MRLPWISRSSHEEVVSLLKAQLSDLAEDRRRLLDRLGSLGLGGPLYATTPDQNELDDPVHETVSDTEGGLLEEMTRLRHRPAKLADMLTRRGRRERERRGAGPQVSWIPQIDRINAALDEAEAAGQRTGAGR